MGGSFAGLEVARKIWEYCDVTLIDKNNFFEYTCTATRGFVSNKRIHDILIGYDKIFERAARNKVDFIQGSLLNVNEDCTIEIVNHMKEGAQEVLKFDYLIICTGG